MRPDLQNRLNRVASVVSKLAAQQNAGMFQHAGKMLEGIVGLFGQPVQQIEGLIKGINSYEKHMKSAPPAEVEAAKKGLLQIYRMIADVNKLATDLAPTVSRLPHFLVQQS